MEKIKKIRGGAKVRYLTTHEKEQMPFLGISKEKARRILPIVSTIAFLTMWIGLCLSHNNLHLNEALICSSIILSILFFRAAEQNGDLSKYD